MNRRANRGRMGKSQKSAKPYGRATTNWIPQSGIQFSPSLSQAKDHPSINVRKILDTTFSTGVSAGILTAKHAKTANKEGSVSRKTAPFVAVAWSVSSAEE